MNKSGIFFTLDAIIGLTILFVGSFIAYSSLVQEVVVQPSMAYAEDVIGIFARTTFKDIDLDRATAIKLLIEQGRIADKEKTVLAQLGEWYYLTNKAADPTEQGKITAAMETLTSNVAKGAVPRQYGWRIKISDPEKTVSPWMYHVQEGSVPTPKLIIVTQHMVFGTYKQQEPYGPYLVEVEIWG